MSAYVEVETVFKDLESLLEALKAVDNRTGMKWTDKDIEVHETPQPLYGYKGDRRKDSAEVIIRRGRVGQSSNDIGFKKNADGTYGAIISEFDSGYYSAEWRQKVNVQYGVANVTKAAKKQGYRMKQEVQADGSVKMKLTRWR